MKFRWLAGIALSVCIILLLFLTGIVKTVTKSVRFITQPLLVWSAEASQRVRDITGRSHASEEQLQDLENRIAREAIDRIRLQTLEDENTTLRTQLNFLQASGYEDRGARVISRDLRNGRMHFLLDRGTNDGVEVGQAVVAANGVFVGKILTARERVSVLEVFTDPEARTIVARAKGGRVMGVVEGRGNGAAILTYIPPSEALEKDDLIITAGTEEKVPPQLAFGLVNQVNGKSTDPFLTAAIEPLLDLERLSFVSILRPRQ